MKRLVQLRDGVTIRRQVPWAEAVRLLAWHRYAIRLEKKCELGLEVFDRIPRDQVTQGICQVGS